MKEIEPRGGGVSLAAVWIGQFYRNCYNYFFSFSIHDPAFKRWMPHVNLTYPFIPDDLDGGQAFKDATERAQKVLASVQPFKVVLTKDSF